MIDINAGFESQLRAYQIANFDTYVAQQILLRSKLNKLYLIRKTEPRNDNFNSSFKKKENETDLFLIKKQHGILDHNNNHNNNYSVLQEKEKTNIDTIQLNSSKKHILPSLTPRHDTTNSNTNNNNYNTNNSNTSSNNTTSPRSLGSAGHKRSWRTAARTPSINNNMLSDHSQNTTEIVDSKHETNKHYNNNNNNTTKDEVLPIDEDSYDKKQFTSLCNSSKNNSNNKIKMSPEDISCKKMDESFSPLVKVFSTINSNNNNNNEQKHQNQLLYNPKSNKNIYNLDPITIITNNSNNKKNNDSNNDDNNDNNIILKTASTDCMTDTTSAFSPLETIPLNNSNNNNEYFKMRPSNSFSKTRKSKSLNSKQLSTNLLVPICKLSIPSSNITRVIPPLRGLEREFKCVSCQVVLFVMSNVVRIDLDLTDLTKLFQIEEKKSALHRAEMYSSLKQLSGPISPPYDSITEATSFDFNDNHCSPYTPYDHSKVYDFNNNYVYNNNNNSSNNEDDFSNFTTTIHRNNNQINGQNNNHSNDEHDEDATNTIHEMNIVDNNTDQPVTLYTKYDFTNDTNNSRNYNNTKNTFDNNNNNNNNNNNSEDESTTFSTFQYNTLHSKTPKTPRGRHSTNNTRKSFVTFQDATTLENLFSQKNLNNDATSTTIKKIGKQKKIICTPRKNTMDIDNIDNIDSNNIDKNDKNLETSEDDSFTTNSPDFSGEKQKQRLKTKVKHNSDLTYMDEETKHPCTTSNNVITNNSVNMNTINNVNMNIVNNVNHSNTNHILPLLKKDRSDEKFSNYSNSNLSLSLSTKNIPPLSSRGNSKNSMKSFSFNDNTSMKHNNNNNNNNIILSTTNEETEKNEMQNIDDTASSILINNSINNLNNIQNLTPKYQKNATLSASFLIKSTSESFLLNTGTDYDCEVDNDEKKDVPLIQQHNKNNSFLLKNSSPNSTNNNNNNITARRNSHSNSRNNSFLTTRNLTSLMAEDSSMFTNNQNNINSSSSFKSNNSITNSMKSSHASQKSFKSTTIDNTNNTNNNINTNDLIANSPMKSFQNKYNLQLNLFNTTTLNNITNPSNSNKSKSNNDMYDKNNYNMLDNDNKLLTNNNIYHKNNNINNNNDNNNSNKNIYNHHIYSSLPPIRGSSFITTSTTNSRPNSSRSPNPSFLSTVNNTIDNNTNTTNNNNSIININNNNNTFMNNEMNGYNHHNYLPSLNDEIISSSLRVITTITNEKNEKKCDKMWSPRDKFCEITECSNNRYFSRLNLLRKNDEKTIKKMIHDDDQVADFLTVGKDGVYYLEYLEWMGQSVFDSSLYSGDICCFNCKNMIGSWSWNNVEKGLKTKKNIPLICIQTKLVSQFDFPLEATPKSTPRITPRIDDL